VVFFGANSSFPLQDFFIKRFFLSQKWSFLWSLFCAKKKYVFLKKMLSVSIWGTNPRQRKILFLEGISKDLNQKSEIKNLKSHCQYHS